MAIPSCLLGALKFVNYFQRTRPSLRDVLFNGTERQYLCLRSCIGICNMYTSDVKTDITAVDDKTVPNPKKKKVFIPRVTLLTENGDMSIVTLDMASRIAKRRNLKLVKILDFDSKTERPIYKLMSTKAFIQEDNASKEVKKMEKQSSLKPEKMLSVSTKINDHDLKTKFKSIVKFLSKKHEVRFVINYDGSEQKSEGICDQLETVLKDLPVTIKKNRLNDRLKIHLCPKIEEMVQDDSEIRAKNETPAADRS